MRFVFCWEKKKLQEEESARYLMILDSPRMMLATMTEGKLLVIIFIFVIGTDDYIPVYPICECLGIMYVYMRYK